MNIRTVTAFEDELVKISSWKSTAATSALGAMGGGIIGASQGKDTKDKVKKGLLGGATGAAGGALLAVGAKKGRDEIHKIVKRKLPAEYRKARAKTSIKGHEGNVISIKPAHTPSEPVKGGGKLIEVDFKNKTKKSSGSAVLDAIFGVQ